MKIDSHVLLLGIYAFNLILNTILAITIDTGRARAAYVCAVLGWLCAILSELHQPPHKTNQEYES